MTKQLSFSTPLEMLEADRRSVTEIWYCHHHREAGFHGEGALSDEYVSTLRLIQMTPGLSQKDTGAKREDISFLESLKLIRVKKITSGGRIVRYEIFITHDGASLLAKVSTQKES